DDLRRLLDEDGIALGEYGEPGATVLSLSALTARNRVAASTHLQTYRDRRRSPSRAFSPS
ncbi:hypothetical protein, partial [Streptomyces umbrinus]|uniref:hypothetical protein n=1 Tax=Streptomyces umbrinus TaxID=67370 RepID=UPI0033D4950B